MTEQPPGPPPGGYPPPPPGGYPPPPPPAAGGYRGPAVQGFALQRDAYTPWLTRVAGFLIDILPLAILQGLAYMSLLPGQQGTACVAGDTQLGPEGICVTGDNGTSGLGLGVAILAMLVSLVFWVWNYGYRQGRTGQSIGKSVLKFQVVSEKTGQPIGFGMSIVRQLAHIIDSAICYIGYLFPLWDAKRQTIADKIMSTVCIPKVPPG